MPEMPCACCGKSFVPAIKEAPRCHRLLCGDATQAADVTRVLGGAKPALMVTDPPYGVDYDPAWRARAGINQSDGKMGPVLNDDRHDWSQAYALAGADVLYVWHGGVHAGKVQESLERCGFQIVSQIIWSKDHFALSRGDYHWQHEPCWYAVRQGTSHNWQGARDQATVWEIARAEDAGHGHSTQKPLECMARPIRNSSQAGDVVYDPFLGSDTTLVACERLGRVGEAVELSPAYVAVALQRLTDMGLEPYLASQGD
jgi:DNA modification methylase